MKVNFILSQNIFENDIVIVKIRNSFIFQKLQPYLGKMSTYLL